MVQATEPQRDRELEVLAVTSTEAARSVQVIDQQTHDLACEQLAAVKALRAAAEAHHRPTIASAWNTHRLACEALNRIDKPLEEAERILRQRIGHWLLEQENLKAIRQREADEARLQEALVQREAEIEALEAEPDVTPEELRAVINAPIITTRAQVPSTYQRAPGVTPTFPYKATCTDKAAMLRYVAEHPQYMNLIDVNEAALNRLAAALKSNLAIPGVRVYQAATVRSSRERGR